MGRVALRNRERGRRFVSLLQRGCVCARAKEGESEGGGERAREREGERKSERVSERERESERGGPRVVPYPSSPDLVRC